MKCKLNLYIAIYTGVKYVMLLIYHNKYKYQVKLILSILFDFFLKTVQDCVQEHDEKSTLAEFLILLIFCVTCYNVRFVLFDNAAILNKVLY